MGYFTSVEYPRPSTIGVKSQAYNVGGHQTHIMRDLSETNVPRVSRLPCKSLSGTDTIYVFIKAASGLGKIHWSL